MTALSAIVTPLAEPCSADDITELTTKKNTAKTTADTAVAEQTKIKTAATEKYDTANEKLISLNEQIAAQGGSAVSGTPETSGAVSGAPETSGAVSGAPETSEVVSGAGSGGSATTQSLDSLNDAADQAKEEADKAADEIAAAEAAINAASDAANALDQLDLSKFTTSGSRFKRQNDNNIVTDANLNLVIESESESFTSSSDNAAGAGAQIVSNSVTESSSSANDVPTTCANLLKLMDEITETLTNNPAGATPLMTALSAIVTPLAEPCSA